MALLAAAMAANTRDEIEAVVDMKALVAAEALADAGVHLGIMAGLDRLPGRPVAVDGEWTAMRRSAARSGSA